MNRTSVRVVKLLIHETGTYAQQFRRPYETVVTGHAVDVLHERLNKFQSNINSGVLAGISNEIIVPSAAYESAIDISSGWNERRMRFLLDVVIDENLGGSSRELIQGYTNGVGVSHNGMIAPDMTFHINSTSLIKAREMLTPMGRSSELSVRDSSHILVNDSFKGFYQAPPEQRLRPEDLFSVMARPSGLSPEDVIDHNNMHSDTICKSQRKHGLATDYVSQLVSAYQCASLNDAFGQSPQNLLQNARSYCQDGSVGNDTFIRAISNIQGGPPRSVFTFDDIVRLDRNVVNVTQAIVSGPTRPNSMHYAGQTANWNGSDRCTQVATIVSQSVPALAMEYAMTGVYLTSTNRSLNGQVETAVFNAQGFTDMDLSRHISAFIHRFNQEIAPVISMNGMTDYAISVNCDLLGETWISVSIDGNNSSMDYVTPSFADALMVPVLTGDRNRATTIGNDLETMMEAVLSSPGQSIDFAQTTPRI